MNLIQETKWYKDENSIVIKILTGSLSQTSIVIQFKKSEIGTSVLIDLKLQTSMKFLLLKKKIEQKILNILQGRLINLDHLTQLLGNGNWNTNLTSDGEGLTISKNSHPIIIYGWYYSAITEIFYSDVYSSLIVEDKYVIDIGANVGDSSIYFVMKGAQKVIAVEPFPKNFNLAEKNIIENHLKDKVFLEKCILTDKEGMNKIDSEYAGTQAGERSNPKSNIRESNDGVEVPMHTLGYLVQKYDLKGASMKIDCEGCEYKIILTSTNEILQRFHNIFIEYHNGYKSLENKLIESGFTVNIHSRVESKMGFMTAIKKSS